MFSFSYCFFSHFVEFAVQLSLQRRLFVSTWQFIWHSTAAIQHSLSTLIISVGKLDLWPLCHSHGLLGYGETDKMSWHKICISVPELWCFPCISQNYTWCLILLPWLWVRGNPLLLSYWNFWQHILWILFSFWSFSVWQNSWLILRWRQIVVSLGNAAHEVWDLQLLSYGHSSDISPCHLSLTHFLLLLVWHNRILNHCEMLLPLATHYV